MTGALTESCWQWSRGWGEGVLFEAPPLGPQSCTITAKPTPPTTRRQLQATSNLHLRLWILLLPSHGRTRCPNNQTLTMNADPSPTLTVLVCSTGSSDFFSIVSIHYLPPSLCLLCYLRNNSTTYLSSHCWSCWLLTGIPWFVCLSGCLTLNLTPGHELRGKHMWYATPCVQVFLYVWCVIDGICKKLSKVSKHLLANLHGNIRLSRD